MTSTWNMRKLVIDISVNLRRNHPSSVNNLASGGNGQCFWASDVASRYLEKGYPDNRYPGQDLLCGLISKLRHILANRYLYMNADTLKKKLNHHQAIVNGYQKYLWGTIWKKYDSVFSDRSSIKWCSHILHLYAHIYFLTSFYSNSVE